MVSLTVSAGVEDILPVSDRVDEVVAAVDATVDDVTSV